jgi:hypothetical protein
MMALKTVLFSDALSGGFLHCDYSVLEFEFTCSTFLTYVVASGFNWEDVRAASDGAPGPMEGVWLELEAGT